MARFMNKNVAGVFVPDHLIQQMTEAENKVKTGLEITANLMRELKGHCQGIHIMAIGWEKKVPELMQLAGM
jgi:methylenetetrahydrofolate reductase (NADPH)